MCLQYVLLFFIEALAGVKMPVYEAEEEKTVKDKKENKKSLSTSRVTLMFMLGFVYFASSTGIEGFFSSQIFTFGLCGPHALPPKTVGKK